MNARDMARRDLLQGSAALAGLALFNLPSLAEAFPRRPGEEIVP